MRSLSVLLVTLALASAGCIGKDRAGDDPPAAVDPPVETAAAPEEAPASPPAEPGVSGPPSSSPPAAPANTTASSAAPAEDAPAAAPRVQLLSWNGTITEVGAGVDLAGQGACCAHAGTRGENYEGAFPLPAGAKGIVAELVWTDPTFDLDLQIAAPDVADLMPPEADENGDVRTSSGHAYADTSGTAGQPNGRVVIVVTDPEALALAGDWAWRVGSKTANAVPFSVHVTVFLDAAPAEGYSAVAA